MKLLRASPALGALLVVAAYMAARQLMYWALPRVTWEEWARQDVAITVWRVTALVVLIWLNRAWWRVSRMDFNWRDWKMTLGYGGSVVALTVAYLANFGPPFYPPLVAGVVMTTTIAVGLFEEYAFRGVIFDGLRRRMSDAAAVMLSSVLFTVFHWQAQPVDVWPEIFLFGVFFANLRLRGMSLGMLAVIHIVYDDLFFVFGTEAPAELHLYQLGLQAGLTTLVFLSWPRRSGARVEPGEVTRKLLPSGSTGDR